MANTLKPINNLLSIWVLGGFVWEKNVSGLRRCWESTHEILTFSMLAYYTLKYPLRCVSARKGETRFSGYLNSQWQLNQWISQQPMAIEPVDISTTNGNWTILYLFKYGSSVLIYVSAVASEYIYIEESRVLQTTCLMRLIIFTQWWLTSDGVCSNKFHKLDSGFLQHTHPHWRPLKYPLM